MSAIKLSDNVYWVGVKDPDLKVFDIIMPLNHGTTYNSYLIKGEKTALIDTVKLSFSDEFFTNIEEVVPADRIDYLIINHTEPDHSGSFSELLKRNPDIQLICAAPAVPFVKNVLNTDANLTGIKDNHELDLGGKKLVFRMTPYMHWPDTMMEYLPEDRILFSCDGFASHLCSERMFDDEVTEDLDHEFWYYFDAIMRPFTGYIRRNLPKLDEFEINMIGASHGPILRRNPRGYIEKYKEWTVDKTEDKNQVTLFFASNYGNTEKIARAMAANLEREGFSVPVIDITATDSDQAKEYIEASIGVVIGTPTFNGDAVKPVWDLVSNFSAVYSIGKKAAVFGSYGWGGEGVKMVAERLSGLKLKVFEENFRVRLVPSDEEMADLERYCIELAAFLKPGK